MLCASNDVKSHMMEPKKESKKPEKSKSLDQEQKSVQINYRLPKINKVYSYKIELKTYFDEEPQKSFMFDGLVTIECSTDINTQSITLHSENLHIREVKLLNFDSSTKPLKWQYESSTKFLKIIDVEEKMEIGSNALQISYEGKLSDDNIGFYKSSYENDDGDTV